MSPGLRVCPACKTELTRVRGPRPGRMLLWCWKCERVRAASSPAEPVQDTRRWTLNYGSVPFATAGDPEIRRGETVEVMPVAAHKEIELRAALAAEPKPDDRSLLVLVEPQFGPDGITWHGMAFIRGKNINDVYGSGREAVYDDCVCAISAVLDEGGER